MALVLVGLVSCSCEESEPKQAPDDPKEAKELPSDRTWQSDHFNYHTRRGDDSVCEALLDNLERHFTAVQTYLDFPWPERKQVNYYKYRNAEDKTDNSACSVFNSSCFYANVGIQTAKPVELHELIHAYLEPIGRSHVALEEGVANALSCGYDVRGRPEPAEQSAVFAQDGWAAASISAYQALYHSSAWFVGWLLNEHGPEPFMAWYVSASGADGPVELADSFAQHYPGTLDEAWKDAFASDTPNAACVRVTECAAPEWSQEDESGNSAADCAWPLSIGRLPVEVPSWLVQTSSGFGLTVDACRGTQPPAHQNWLRASTDGHNGEVFVVAVPAGEYFVSQSPRYEAGSVRLFNRDPESNPPNDCSELIPLTLDFTRNLTIALPRDEGTAPTQFIRWVDGVASGQRYAVQCDNAGSARWCPGCGECASACDSNVMVEYVSGMDEGHALEFTSDGEQARWVRLTRTF